MLRFTASAFSFAAALGVSLHSSTPMAADSWQAYTYWGSSTVVASKGFRKLVEDIEQASGGELKIKFNLGGTLSINAANINAAVSDDIVQIADDAFYHNTIPLAGLSSLPFLARSMDDMSSIMAIVKPLAETAYAKKGVIALGYYIYPPQVFWFRSGINSLEGMKGRKIRVSSAEQGAIVRSFGGTPVQLGSADVPAALERGVVDGVLTAAAGGVLAWKELLKSSYTLGVNYPVAYILANAERFNKLSPALQQKVRDIVGRHLAEQTAELQREDAELRKRFASEGIAITPAKPEEIAKAEELSKAVWEDWAKSRGAEAVQALDRARKTLGR
jgi:TRAP-type C4-dicarboxylate transport system substrate-binding protein